jgi:hypothetical protein
MFYKIGPRFEVTGVIKPACFLFYDRKKFCRTSQYYKLFMTIIMPLAAYFSMILTELRQ